MKTSKMKQCIIIACTLALLSTSFQSSIAQNVDGATMTCAGTPYNYRPNPAGGTLKNWAVFGGQIVSGTIHTANIIVVWEAGNNSLSWMAGPHTGGGDGGHKNVTTIEKVAATLVADCNLGSNLVNASAGSPSGATRWQWTFTGFGYSSEYTTTTTSPSLNITVPNASAPGTICVKAYFNVCGGYGASTCNSYP